MTTLPPNHRALLAFMAMGGLLCLVGFGQSWSVALGILNLCLISAVMALGVNIQWGYAGLFNAGVMGFAALGGLAAVLVSSRPVTAAWVAGGANLLAALGSIAAMLAAVALLYRYCIAGRRRRLAIGAAIIIGLIAARYFYLPGASAIEAVEPARYGYLGGLGWPILWSWLVGGVFAAAGAWLVGRIALGLRADYLAIATLGIAEIIIAILKNEDWLTRGVKNVTGLARPVPYEIDLQTREWFITAVQWLNTDNLATAAEPRAQLAALLIEYSGLVVKLCYAGLFTLILLVILWLSTRALYSPWGRMMRAIRDNETAAAAMGKAVTARHRQVFILGSAVVGIAGAMLTTLDGQFTPGSYNPLRFTFLVWVMVIIGGSGNNLGAVLGGFVVWFFWIEAEPLGLWLVTHTTVWLGDSPLRAHLLNNAQHMRLLLMGVILLLVLRFTPGGLLPEVIKTTEPTPSPPPDGEK